MTQRRHNRRSGQTLILFTLAVLPVFGILGLVVDIGWAYFRKEAAKTAADAATNAAAVAAYAASSGNPITCSTAGVSCFATDHTCPATTPTGPIDNITAGCLYAKDNGFTTAGKQTVTFRSGVGTPPGSSGITVGYWVMGTVTEQIPQTFSAVLGFPTLTVAAQSITGDQNPAAGGGGCIFSLATTGSGTISLSGSSTLESGCGVYDNSTSSTAISMSGTSIITTTGTAKTRIVGNWNSGGGSVISPAPLTGSTAMTDPWASMQAPTVGVCTDGNAGVRLTGSSNQTINPGVICGGISVQSSSVLTLMPGLYIVKNGISVSGSSTLTGTGVTIYLLSGALSAGGSSILTLSAPLSGTWQGVVLFQDRANATAASLSGSTNQAINGLVYIPSAALTYSGGSSSNKTTTTIVSRTLSLTGSTFIRAPAATAYSPNLGGTVVIH